MFREMYNNDNYLFIYLWLMVMVYGYGSKDSLGTFFDPRDATSVYVDGGRGKGPSDFPYFCFQERSLA